MRSRLSCLFPLPPLRMRNARTGTRPTTTTSFATTIMLILGGARPASASSGPLIRAWDLLGFRRLDVRVVMPHELAHDLTVRQTDDSTLQTLQSSLQLHLNTCTDISAQTSTQTTPTPPTRAGLSTPALLVLSMVITMAGILLITALVLVALRIRRRRLMTPARLDAVGNPRGEKTHLDRRRGILSTPSTAGPGEHPRVNFGETVREIEKVDMQSSSSPVLAVLKHWGHRRREEHEIAYSPILDLEAGRDGQNKAKNKGKTWPRLTMNATGTGRNGDAGETEVQLTITPVSPPRAGARHPFHVSPVLPRSRTMRPMTLLRPPPLQVNTKSE